MIDIEVGLRNAGFRTGLEQMRGQAQRFAADIQSKLSKSINFTTTAVGAAATALGFDSIITKAGQINDLSQRFGIGAEGLQRIGNAAKQNGSSMESVASAMNKIAVNQEKVRQGDGDLIASLGRLNIDAAKFINLSPEEAFYEIADAMNGASDRGVAYKAVLDIMGKKSGDLVTTLEMGSDAIRELGERSGIFTEETINNLDNLGDSIEATKGRIAVSAGGIISWFDKVARTAGALAGGMWADTKKLFGQGPGDNGAAGQTANEIWSGKKEDAPASSTKKAKRVVEEDTADTEKKAASEAERSERELLRLTEEIAEIEEKARLEALDGERRLQELMRKREQMAKMVKDGGTVFSSEANLQMQKEIANLNKQIADEKQKQDKEGASKEDRIAQALQREQQTKEDIEYDDMDPQQKMDFLQKKKDRLEGEADVASSLNGDEETAANKRTEAMKVGKQMRDVGDEDDRRKREEQKQKEQSAKDAWQRAQQNEQNAVSSLSASSLRRVGGGGGIGSSNMGGGDPNTRIYERQAATLENIYKAIVAQGKAAGTSQPAELD